jgi:SAM-dependent MidA family methyltransferase
MRVELPQPSPEESAHSDRVAALIRAEIAAAGGAIDFSRYMELALYAPGLGYYSAGKTKFGADGDFVTAPELGFLFARCLARALIPTLRATAGDVLELGPGSGALAAELLLELERLGVLPPHYRLLERSADLRARQRETLHDRCPHLLQRCEWLDTPPHAAWSGALIANEVLDALPVRVFALRNGDLHARAVACDAQGAFVWRDVSADAHLRSDVQRTLGERVHALPQPYVSEICPLLAPWFAEVSRSLESGIALFIDYGYTREEYYAPQRTHGTLRCHYRHRAHDDPLILPGIQDITAWVDFDALGEAAAASRWRIQAASTQSRFLIEHGLNDVFETAFAAATTESQRYGLAQQAKHLMLPEQMGERFRVMSLMR